MEKHCFKYSLILLFLFAPAAFCAQEGLQSGDTEAAGEFYGTPVSMDNYRFARAAAAIFGVRWGAEPQTAQEMEDRVWEDLLLSYEAFRRNILVEQREVDEEISKMLAADKVVFDWKADKAAYERWVGDQTKEPREVFENQIRHLMQIQKLRQEIIDSLKPTVTEEEALVKFLNQYNTLSVEFVRFDDLGAAHDYYQRMKDPKLWQKEAKKDPKFAVRPGFVSLEFLIEVWKLPKEDAYAMLELPIGSVYKPTKVYKGYGVFHTLEKSPAEKEKFSDLRQSYFDQVRRIKQYAGFTDWLKQFKKEANMRVFIK